MACKDRNKVAKKPREGRSATFSFFARFAVVLGVSRGVLARCLLTRALLQVVFPVQAQGAASTGGNAVPAHVVGGHRVCAARLAAATSGWKRTRR
jgi:hypothetical protein